MFSTWTVPQRFLTSDHPDSIEPPLHLKSTEDAIEDTKLAKELEENLEISAPPPPASPPPSAKTASRVGSAASVQAPPRMIDRNMSKTLPEIEMRKLSRGASRDHSRNYTRLPNMMRAGASMAVPQVAAPRVPSAVPQSPARVEEKPDDMSVIRQEIEHSFQPHAVEKAEQWMKTAPSPDRRVIEKVLRLTERKQRIENSLGKTLQPDAKATVESWLNNANEPERQVALKFFNSVAGHQLMGAGINEQKRRLQAVVDALETGKGQCQTPKPASASKGRALGSSRLKHVRLLSPGTRQNKWMYSTWHHLPEYKDHNIVDNWSSHYIKPHEHTPRHFVIHPDWG